MGENRAAGAPRVVVIGAGVSGLAAARVLAGMKPASSMSSSPMGGAGWRVLILEASESLGGKVQTGELAGQAVELGPDQFLRRDASAERLCQILGLGEKLAPPAARSAAVFSRGKMRGLPSGLVLGVPTDLDAVARSGIVSGVGVERGRRDSVLDGPLLQASEVGLLPTSRDRARGERLPEERSAGEILRARLGGEIVDRLVDPLLGGINAGSVDTMSLGTVAPQLAQALVGHRDVVSPLAATIAHPTEVSGGGRNASPFLGLRGGLGQMIAACRAELESAGVEIELSAPVTSIEPAPQLDGWRVHVGGRAGARTLECEGVVLAVPGGALGHLLGAVSADLGHELAAIPYASVAVLTAAFAVNSVSLPDEWTGVLVPKVEGKLMTAATWLSVKWPWIATRQARFVRVSAGRYGDERIMGLDDEELAAILTTELGEVAGIGSQPVDQSVTRWDSSFPQYQPGHRARIARVTEAVAALPRIELAGAVLGGIGIPACITSGEAAAARLVVGMRR
ncbi:MAG: protoporphyrinogen oxidase [Acidimicrobiales bacterium]